MNIGTEGKTSKIDKKGVALLAQTLNSNDNFECHFKDEDKVPNSDGFFVIKSEGIPNRRFDVQIKTTEKINKLKDGTISFQFDTKFINYANLGVTTDPCIIFHADVKNEKIYYKILSEEFLDKNYFLDTDQSSVSIHFDPINEIINDVDDFYKILDAFTQYKKSFNIKKINIIDYQKSFDFINNFFDTDFHLVKKTIFPKVWKFGVAYQKKLDESFGDLKYFCMYGIYQILFGEKTLPFQQIKNFSTSKLNYISGFTSNSSREENIDEIMNEFVGNFIYDFLSNINNCISFLPSDALFEILFNYYCTWFPLDESEELTLSDYENVFYGHYKSFEESDIKTISLCLKTLKERNVDCIKRVFKKIDYSKLWDKNEVVKIEDNNAKLLSSISDYYKQFCSLFFDENKKSNIEYFGQYKVLLSIEYEPYSLIETYYSKKIEHDGELSFVISKSKDELIDFNQCGCLDTDFRDRVNNIANSVITLLFKAFNRFYKFEKDNLGFKTPFNNFNLK
ncbi:MAG: DUF4365 domain-containing protein [Bacilli bacterium]